LTKVLFMGRKKVSSVVLRCLFLNPDVIIVGVLMDEHLKDIDLVRVANQLSIPLYSYENAINLIKKGELVYDLGVSILYWKKLQDEFLTLPCKGVINFHPAPLPEYKGTCGYNLAILDSKNSWAVTAHYMNNEIDAGRIIERINFPIDADYETVSSIEEKSMAKIEELALSVINKAIICNSYLPSFKNEGGRYVSRSEMESLKEVSMDDDIERKIRAFWYPPYNGAFIRLNNKKYTLVNQRILHDVAPKKIDTVFINKE
jgi:methionyl-tRNA formyltransferase